MKYLATILFLLVYTQSQLQSALEGRILDLETDEPIAFVNIGIPKDGIGTVSDREGKFRLICENPEALITISSIGYETREIKASVIKKSGDIRLSKKEYEIEEVSIVASRFSKKETMLGVKNKDRGHSIGFGSAQLGSEIGAIIKVEKPFYVLNANFVLNHAKGDSLLFRVNIYKYVNGEIGNHLLDQNILIKDKQRKGVFSVDLSLLELILESDVLLSLEWLRNYDETGNKEITFDTKKSRRPGGTYLKNYSNGRFYKVDYDQKMTPCFYFIGKQAL